MPLGREQKAEGGGEDKKVRASAAGAKTTAPRIRSTSVQHHYRRARGILKRNQRPGEKFIGPLEGKRRFQENAEGSAEQQPEHSRIFLNCVLIIECVLSIL